MTWDDVFADPSAPVIEAAYDRARRCAVSAAPCVLIMVPAYQPTEQATRVSIAATTEDLRRHGIDHAYVESGGDSLVTRGRHCLMHQFLLSSATHLLQWDADVEMCDPSAVRAMLASGHDVIGCAYPWRDGSGRVVANPLHARATTDEHRCIPVKEIGTGFLMTSRRCIVDLCARHPELLYECDIPTFAGAPMWALFDVALEPKGNGRKRYASEDWRFCTLAREAGYDVNLYLPPRLRHWGRHGFEGHVMESWNMRPVVPAADAAPDAAE